MLKVRQNICVGIVHSDTSLKQVYHDVMTHLKCEHTLQDAYCVNCGSCQSRSLQHTGYLASSTFPSHSLNCLHLFSQSTFVLWVFIRPLAVVLYVNDVCVDFNRTGLLMVIWVTCLLTSSLIWTLFIDVLCQGMSKISDCRIGKCHDVNFLLFIISPFNNEIMAVTII